MKQFDRFLKEKTENKYPFVRFVRAEYSCSENKLTLFMIARADAVDNGLLSDEVKKEIIQSVSESFPADVVYAAKYVKVSADEDAVRIKLMQALNKAIPVACESIADEDIKITVNATYSIDVNILAKYAVCALLNNEEKITEITEWLNEFFVENINFEVGEKYISDDEIAKNIEKNKQIIKNSDISGNVEMDSKGNKINVEDDVYGDLIDSFGDSIELYAQSRQIKVTQLKNLVGKSYLNARPTYIADINENTMSATVCGTVTGLSKRTRENKYFGQKPDEKSKFKRNYDEQTLPWYSFLLDDTTGKLAVVYFPAFTPDYDFEQAFVEGAHVCVTGKVSERNGTMQIIVDKMWQVEIDFSTISLEKQGKKESRSYSIVHPEKYFEEAQFSIDDLQRVKQETAPYLRGKSFVVFDLETTGLDTKSCKIVQLGSYKIVDGKIVETFNTLINPGCHIPEDSTRIHGITDGDVLCAPTFEAVLPDFYKFTRGATLVGHNCIGYDYPILKRYADEAGYDFDNALLDTWPLAKSQFTFSNYKLETIAKELDLGLENAHRADFDAIATAKLFLILAKNL